MGARLCASFRVSLQIHGRLMSAVKLTEENLNLRATRYAKVVISPREEKINVCIFLFYFKRVLLYCTVAAVENTAAERISFIRILLCTLLIRHARATLAYEQTVGRVYVPTNNNNPSDGLSAGLAISHYYY